MLNPNENQSSLGSQGSLGSDDMSNYFDSSSTLPDPVSEGINGTIKLVGEENDQKIQLIIPGSDYEKFKEYENTDVDGKVIGRGFFASFKKAGKGDGYTVTPTKEENNQLIINSVNGKGNNIADDLGLGTSNPEISGSELFMNSPLVYSKEVLETKIQELEAEKKKAEEELRTKLIEAKDKQKELQTQLDTANTEKTDLQQQLASSTDEQKKVNDATDSLFTEKLNGGISGLIGLTGQELEDKVKSLYDEKLKNAIEDIISNNLSEMKGEDKGKLHEELQGKILSVIETDQSKDVNEIVKLIKPKLTDGIINASKFNKEVADLQQQLQAKDEEITALKAQQNTQEVTDLKQQLAGKEKEIAQLKQQQPNAEVNKLKADLTAKEKEVDKLKKENEELEAKINQPNAEVKTLKNDLKTKTSQVQQLTQKNKELEAKNKTTEQPKQSNAARYTATAGVGLAAGLTAFTALERTVRLDMWLMVGIAVASALVAGGITYAVLPSTQVDGAKAQEVSGIRKASQ